MNYYNKLLKIKRIKDKLLDQESEAIFNARIDYMITRKEDPYIEAIWPFLNNMYCPDLLSVLNKRNGQPIIIIFGCGHDGKRTKDVLEKCGYIANCFCDNDINKIGKFIYGLPVVSLNEIKKYNNYLVVLASRLYKKEMYSQLVEMKIPKENIILPDHPIVLGTSKLQYFDTFKFDKDEVFLDAGAYDGDTTQKFILSTNGLYKGIYVLEPLDKQFQYIKKISKEEGWKNITLYQKAVWNCKQKLHFCDMEMGSAVVENDTGVYVQGESIDNIVGDDKITFIKMDVEGSELRALEGARKTIQSNKPKLAISIYHKYEDIIDLPLKILDIVPEYKFYIKHYTTDIWETVLYAFV